MAVGAKGIGSIKAHQILMASDKKPATITQ